jgi:hypothetical protein
VNLEKSNSMLVMSNMWEVLDFFLPQLLNKPDCKYSEWIKCVSGISHIIILAIFHQITDFIATEIVDLESKIHAWPIFG